ncbi:MAG: tRNA pseudouridine(55) synthase TruB [Eubacteriales bacterium]|nr:tRNA pseudouridine(55) synthase TruB [Eubacteriales bacterium]
MLNILKPPGMTSFDVVAFLRKLTGIKKIGHSGTLDPLASGVLPVCTGRNATKILEYMIGMDKSYRAELTLGITTDTMDAEGKVLNISGEIPGYEKIIEAMHSFEGEIEQVPPMYSAVKYNGKKLYELARQGISVERKARRVTVYRLKVISVEKARVMFNVDCSSGTYIRTICSDIGEKLGCGAYMTFLERTAVGPYKIEDAVTVEEISNAFAKGEGVRLLMPPESALGHLNRAALEPGAEIRFRNGINTAAGKITLKNASAPAPIASNAVLDGELLRVYDSAGEFLGVGRAIKRDELLVKPEKVLNQGV